MTTRTRAFILALCCIVTLAIVSNAASNGRGGQLVFSSGNGGTPGGAAGGDLGGTYPNPSVAKINGNAIAPSGTTGTTTTNLVFSTSPVLVTPALGTPSSGVLTNCTAADPTASSALATKNYVDTVATGIEARDARLATNAVLSGTYAYVAGVITEVGFGALTIDGVSTAVNDRIVVKNETGGNAPYNGIYVVTATGSGAASYILTRASDMNTSGEFGGALTFIAAGTANTQTSWICTTYNPTVGVTNIAFSQFSLTPSGAAGGDLTGTYPNPTVASTTGTGSFVKGTSPTVNTDAITATIQHLTENAQTDNYTLVLGDDYKVITLNNAGAKTLNIPTDASVAFPTGTQITVIQKGAGQYTIAATTPGTTTVVSNGGTAASPKLRVQYSAATLWKDAANHWYVTGDIQ